LIREEERSCRLPERKPSAGWGHGNSTRIWIQLEKSFPLFSRTWTGFGSYELYYDSRFDKWGQRHRLIGGVSIPIVSWSSVDIFYGYHVENEPKDEDAGALGIAFGFYFNWDEKGFRLAKSAASLPPSSVPWRTGMENRERFLE
jgi:hypothetical protein